VRYIGVDIEDGDGVDAVIRDAHKLPLESESFEVVIASSCFEHSEMFWIVFIEALRVQTPHGLFYLNAPSNGVFHRFPVDCWRFYPDAGRALVSRARRSGLNAALLEPYICFQRDDI
jgi:SAM-dependent methyltransferase